MLRKHFKRRIKRKSDARNATRSVLKVKAAITGTCPFTAWQGFVDAKSSYAIFVNSFCEDITSKFCRNDVFILMWALPITHLSNRKT